MQNVSLTLLKAMSERNSFDCTRSFDGRVISFVLFFSISFFFCYYFSALSIKLNGFQYLGFKVKKSHTSQGGPQKFRSMKQLRVLLLPPGWDVGPSQGLIPPAVCRRYPLMHLCGEKKYGLLSFLSKETTWWQGLGGEPPTFRSEASIHQAWWFSIFKIKG